MRKNELSFYVRTRVKFYRKFLMTNINSLRHNASCTPSVHNNRTCHIVYLDGAPSYPASGYNLSLTLIMCEVLTFIFCRSCFWYCLAGTIQWISTHTANLSFGPFSCGIRRKHHVSRSRGWNVSVFELFINQIINHVP